MRPSHSETALRVNAGGPRHSQGLTNEPDGVGHDDRGGQERAMLAPVCDTDHEQDQGPEVNIIDEKALRAMLRAEASAAARHKHQWLGCLHPETL